MNISSGVAGSLMYLSTSLAVEVPAMRPLLHFRESYCTFERYGDCSRLCLLREVATVATGMLAL